MIRTFTNTDGRFVHSGDTLEHLDGAVWVDMLRPDRDEETAVERALGIDVPTIEEMSEIEVSSRLYTEDGATFMTAMMLSHTDADNVLLSPITFILKGEQLITVRYAEPRSIDAFIVRCQKNATYTADGVVTGLLEGLIERIGDVLERTGHELDSLSDNIFAINAPKVMGGEPAETKKPAKPKPRNYQAVLQQIGRKGDLLSKARESLISFQRLLTFGVEIAASRKPGKEYEGRIRTLSRDVQSLSDHTTFLTQKINFLLDATLGMINIEQTGIIKIFSVAAVVFLPPTLIASIYGMNFEYMPELSWPYGYPMAIGLMILSAIVPYQFFKWRGWL
ncbi:MAG: magnesium transporter [Hyphomonas sp.]|uniref:magnesium transporter CorA family protein n=1 Tax=Hyphomonas sp. TaxID=87 RepID=UPI001D6200CC|nr:magnesium transporter CorA family protein [Hyphomonas sp.]MBA4227969.1 magnesium transporter [Hyphomonas sp.]